MSSYIGIDLGTTFSAVATLDETGRPVIIKNREENLLPSAVMINKGSLLVGEQARKAYQTSGNVAARFKRYMGEKKTYELAGKTYSPTDLSVAVLKKLKMIAEKHVGRIAEAVVTIPANFPNEAREETMAAARRAGLNVQYIINEPTAAALYYAFKEGKNMRGTYAVYDLGGGTFDVSVIRIDGQDIEVLASGGVKRLGGDDFDKALIELVADKFKQETGGKLNNDPDDLHYTLNDAEADKKSLSNKNRVIAGGGEPIDGHIIEVKRSALEEKISSYIVQTEMLCETTVEEAGLAMSDIQGVLLAGGSTRMPWVSRSIKKVFGKEPTVTANVDEVVALGAVLYATYKSDGKHLSAAQEQAVNKIQLQEVANHCYGTISLSYSEAREEEELINNVLIHKGEKLPCSQTKSFYTVADGQTGAHCRVTQSTHPETDPNFVTILAERELGNLPPNRPAGQEIEVTFSYDDSEIMHCSFVDVATGRKEEFDIHIKTSKGSSGSGVDIDKILVD